MPIIAPLSIGLNYASILILLTGILFYKNFVFFCQVLFSFRGRCETRLIFLIFQPLFHDLVLAIIRLKRP